MERVAKEMLRLAKALLADDDKVVTAGTWALPMNEANVKAIVAIYKRLKSGRLPKKLDSGPISDVLYNLLGDDELFDTLGRHTVAYCKDCADEIKRWVDKLQKKHQRDEYRDPESFDMIEQLAAQL